MPFSIPSKTERRLIATILRCGIRNGVSLRLMKRQIRDVLAAYKPALEVVRRLPTYCQEVFDKYLENVHATVTGMREIRSEFGSRPVDQVFLREVEQLAGVNSAQSDRFRIEVIIAINEWCRAIGGRGRAPYNVHTSLKAAITTFVERRLAPPPRIRKSSSAA